jgi:hypothetical protein
VNIGGERKRKETVLPEFKVLSPEFVLRDLEDIRKSALRDNLCPGQYSNWSPPKYESEALPLATIYFYVRRKFFIYRGVSHAIFIEILVHKYI